MTDDELLAEQIRRVTIGLESRVQAMVVYGLIGVGIGVMMILTGGPSAVEAASGPFIRVAFGVPALVAGVLMICGAFNQGRTARAWWSALIGTALFCLWGTVMASTYIIAAWHDGVVIGPPWEAIPRLSARPYAVVLLEGLSVLLLLHAITLARLGKPRG